MENPPMPAADKNTNGFHALAFVALDELEKNVFRGGILVTDTRGKPLEFRCTTAIQPTSVQKTLYGDTLLAHMCVELTGKPLLSAIKEKPQSILVTQDQFFELRAAVDVPLLLVCKQGSTVATRQDPDKPMQSELLASSSGKFDPIVITTHWQFHGDIRQILPELDSLFSHFDLLEPFSRISNALKLLHEKGLVPNK